MDQAISRNLEKLDYFLHKCTFNYKFSNEIICYLKLKFLLLNLQHYEEALDICNYLIQ